MQTASAQKVTITEDSLRVDLSDGRTVSVPLIWYPRLVHGRPKERNNWRLIADGQGIHWPDLDEDLSVESIVLGHASGESQSSLKRWLESREEPSRRRRVARSRAAREASRPARPVARQNR